MRMIRDRSFWMGLVGAIVGFAVMYGVTANPLAGIPTDAAVASTGPTTAAYAAPIDQAYSVSASAPRLIPFQAYLTDTDGQPINEKQWLRFRLYAASGTSLNWVETHKGAGDEGIPISRGMVNVLLGSVTPFPDGLSFDEPRYVGVAVGDASTIDTATELVPRQQILSAIHAVDADRVGDGQVGGFRANSAEIVPVGGTIAWFGNPASLPTNWRVCDGSVVNDPQSPLNGKTLPDLRSRFLRGEGVASRDLITGGLARGGSDQIDLRHTHTIPSDGSHAHSTSTAPDGDHTHDFVTSPAFVLGDFQQLGIIGPDWVHLPSGVYPSWFHQVGDANVQLYVGGWTHGHSGVTYNSGPHSHQVSMAESGIHGHGGSTGNSGSASQDIRPDFVALHYIIRIK